MRLTIIGDESKEPGHGKFAWYRLDKQLREIEFGKKAKDALGAYLAVIAMDGDHMGAKHSGFKAPEEHLFATVASAVKGNENAVANFTGGTKPMSPGAYGAANAARAPSFYVDTERGEFLDGTTGSGLLDFFANGNLSIAGQSTADGQCDREGKRRRARDGRTEMGPICRACRSPAARREARGEVP